MGGCVCDGGVRVCVCVCACVYVCVTVYKGGTSKMNSVLQPNIMLSTTVV